jgi:hypothetical protein
MREKIHSGRRKFLFGSATALLGALLYKVSNKNGLMPLEAAELTKKTALPPNPRLGLNLAGISDWATEQPFVDFFKQSRDWVSQSPSGDWGTGPQLVLDEQGWIKELAPNCRATRIIATYEKGEYPSGEYVILYDGEGELKPSANGRIVERVPGRLVLSVNANKGSLMLDLVSTNPQNYLRNIRVIIPGFENKYQENPWHPEFLKRWAGIACLRMMDFMATNNSTQTNWQSRPKPNDASYSAKGVPVELLVDLANRLETDVWFCIPHQADDDYVFQLASDVKQQLKPNLRAWFEYSNEVWNGMFKQNQYAAEMGQKLKLSDKPWEAAWKYTAYRSIEIFNILDKVFSGQPERMKKVLASHAANAYVSEQIVSFNQAFKKADALAIAPYVSMMVGEQGNKALPANKVENWGLDQVFQYLNNAALPESTRWIQDNKKVANRYGLQLVAYEAGQHLVGVMGAENNQKITNLLMAANADKRMGDIYSKNLQAWLDAGGDLICTFNSMGGWSKWGSWGLLQNNLENPKDSTKLNAVIHWAKSRGQKMKL